MIKRNYNVIIVLTDDQGYGDFSFSGNPIVKTPNIDQINQKGVSFSDFHVAPMCAPTRGQLTTGRDAFCNGVYNVFGGKSFIHPEVKTMSEIFKNNGYSTGHFGKWHLGENYPFRPEDRGFDESIYFRGSCITASSDYWTNDCFNDTYWHNGKLEKYEGYCTDVWFDKAMEWIEEQSKKNKPFFSNIWTNAPHFPHYVPKEYRERFDEMNLPASTHEIYDVEGFYGMIENLDYNMGRLYKFMEEKGLLENTILLFMTDNGGTGGTHIYNADMRGEKCSYYEGGHRVPLIMQFPKSSDVKEIDISEMCEVQDVLPTLIDCCGFEEDFNQFDGISLLPRIMGDKEFEKDRKSVVQISFLPIDRMPQKWECTVMQGNWRLVKGKELFDIAKDPTQKNNVITDFPEKAEELFDFYEEWWEENGAKPSRIAYISINPEKENPIFLSSHDWFETRCGHKSEVLQALERKGPWNINVEKPGKYLIQLSRWPKEVDTRINDRVKEIIVTDKLESHYIYPSPKKAEFGYVRLRCFNMDLMKEIPEEAKEVEFIVDLPTGKTQLITQFYDKKKNGSWGCYFAYIYKIDD